MGLHVHIRRRWLVVICVCFQLCPQRDLHHRPQEGRRLHRPCRVIAPVYAEMSKNYPQLMFLPIDVDDLMVIPSYICLGKMTLKSPVGHVILTDALLIHKCSAKPQSMQCIFLSCYFLFQRNVGKHINMYAVLYIFILPFPVSKKYMQTGKYLLLPILWSVVECFCHPDSSTL
uniref:Uncharacterized protein n=3 Tax=Aegilops tauschii subsp. strangulata TaxID=200361 RepID=A0A452YNG0_AEGTS